MDQSAETKQEDVPLTYYQQNKTRLQAYYKAAYAKRTEGVIPKKRGRKPMIPNLSIDGEPEAPKRGRPRKYETQSQQRRAKTLKQQRYRDLKKVEANNQSHPAQDE